MTQQSTAQGSRSSDTWRKPFGPFQWFRGQPHRVLAHQAKHRTRQLRRNKVWAVLLLDILYCTNRRRTARNGSTKQFILLAGPARPWPPRPSGSAKPRTGRRRLRQPSSTGLPCAASEVRLRQPRRIWELRRACGSRTSAAAETNERLFRETAGARPSSAPPADEAPRQDPAGQVHLWQSV